MNTRGIAADELTDVLAGYDVGELLAPPAPCGGTANANVTLETSAGRLFLKRRSPKYSVPGYVAFDHRLMEHLHGYGVGTPLALRSRPGDRWLERNGAVYELFPFYPGGAHDRRSLAQIADAGRRLAAFHAASREFDRPAGKEWPRYQDPARIREGVEAMGCDLRNQLDGADYLYLMEQIERLECAYPDARYHALPKLVVHGDYHPGNLKFVGDRVSGIYDLDWATLQPRVLDLADGIFLFAGERRSDIDAADIVSLTQSWLPSVERARAFLDGYRQTEVVSAEEWDVLDLAVRARWLFCRVGGRVKLPPERQAEYVADGLLEPLRALDELVGRGW